MTDYSFSSKLKGRYNRLDYMENVKSLYKNTFKIPSSNQWPLHYTAQAKLGSLLNRLFPNTFKNLPVRSYKFNYDQLILSSKKFRNKIFEYLDTSEDEKVIRSFDKFEQYITQGKLSYSFVDSILSYQVIKSTFIKN